MDDNLTPEEESRLEELMRELETILKPGPGSKLYVAVADSEDLARLTEGYEDDTDGVDSVEVAQNVIHIQTKQPVYSETQQQDELREATLEFLSEISDDVRAGKLRDFVLIAGVDNGDLVMSDCAHFWSPGVIDQATLFLGGMSHASFDLANHYASLNSEYEEE